MTTIACNRQQMAADTQISAGGHKYHADKIFRIGNSLVGAAGDSANCTKFMQWFRRECPADVELIEVEGGECAFEALVLNDKGIFIYSNLSEPDEIHEDHFAIGSGAYWAIAAMDLNGNTPSEAVGYASRKDPNTGGDIDVLLLEPMKPRRRVKERKPTLDTTTEPTES